MFQGAEHTVLNGDIHSENNLWDGTGGPPRVKERAINVESEFDYGSRAGVWRLFRLFNKHNMKFTLYGVGKALEDNPAFPRSCTENGHDVASHAYRYGLFADRASIAC